MIVVTFILTAIAGFLAFWAGVVSLIGFMGWKPLAERYPAERWPDGEGVRMGWQSARVGLSSYSGALNAVVTAEGLYLRPVRLFAYNHPPIFIPWQAVTGLDDGIFNSITLGLEEGTGLRLSGRLAKEVRSAYEAWAAAGVEHAPHPGLAAEAPEEDERAASWRRTRVR